MKKFKVAALMMCLVAVSMMFVSCQKNEDLIVGKWKLTKVTGGNVSASNEDNGIGSIYEFRSDNSCSISYEGFSVSGTYTITEDYLTITMSVLGVSSSQKAKIETLKKKSMVLVDESDNSKAEFEKI